MRRISIALDWLLGLFAFFVAYLFKNFGPWYYIHPGLFQTGADLWHSLPVLVMVPFVTVLALGHNGHYTSQRIVGLGTITRRIALSCFEAMVICYALLSIGGRVFAAGYEPSRGMAVLTPFFSFFLLLLKSLVVQQILQGLRRRGHNFRSLLLVGSGEPLREFIQMLRSHPVWGFRIEGVLSDSAEAKAGDRFEEAPVLGTLDQLFEVLSSRVIDEVVFTPSRTALESLTPYLQGCEEMGIRATLSLNFHQPAIARPFFEHVEDIPLVCYSPTREMNLALMFKYAFDRVAAVLLLILASPFMLGTALAIWLTSKRGEPIFYGQTRVGLNGRLFTLWKFRSMRVGADKEVDKLRALNEVDGPVFKIKNDPRVTPVGRFIRKYSLDELPQIYNVLRGDMSLVGPRPPIPSEVAQYDRWQRRRLSMKPGITCLWQVMGRNKLSFDTWMKLDLQYIDNWSLFLDFKILLKTVVVVVTGHGAM
ncbi:MAG: sugar transferase [Candidatus Sumerlaeia bacterium]|nr:sugar transferase [Candidatus Sumerlaeia bacterium]